ncbi:hypothetical protein A7P54_03625 [Acinetobacter sp. Ac_3412]|uniref:ATP-binding protein n=1 Tax=Acinetobacter sp. Ac_3412 TaxID=1848935 RepID=UPI00149068EF|nr:ATP-binding protein [Acinetobacter sp. Ac_3412]NNP75508.1 hypothetical protein [Acinetobacter sp. Ac_3412]
MSKDYLADTRPAKDYLVNGITKDVTIEECIFDLIDNSIDAYPLHDKELISDYQPYLIEINFNKECFSIEDKGCGIPRTSLISETLRFGTKTQHHSTSIGFYGIGLNRALFKLGRKIHICTETVNERSKINLDVSEFLNNNEWTLPITDETRKGTNGTLIKINNLNNDVSNSFINSEWIKTFTKEISIRYSEFINKNLHISVNEKLVEACNIKIRDTSGFTKRKKEFNHNGIKVVIELGQNSDHFFNYEKSYNKKPNATPQDCGWFVFCNDRAVKLFDWTADTGWHTKFHSEHNGFIGKAYFIGQAGSLPWNTSKTDIDLNHVTYKKALQTMKSFSESWRTHVSKVLKKGYRPITEENPIQNDLFGNDQQGQQDQQQAQQDQQQAQQDQQQGQQDQQQTQQDQQQGQQDQQQTQQDQQQGQQDQQQAQQDQQQGQQDQQQTQQDQQQDQQQAQQDQQLEEEDEEEELPSHEQLLYDIPPHALSQNVLFPKGKHPFNIPPDEKKLCAIINEMSKLRLDPQKGSPYAVLFLLRAFIELSCKYYIKTKKSKINLSQLDSLAEQVERCLDHMVSKNAFDDDTRDVDSIRALCNINPSQKTVRSIQYLQNTLHHPKNIWDKDNINAFWYSILPFLIKCYE